MKMCSGLIVLAMMFISPQVVTLEAQSMASSAKTFHNPLLATGPDP